MSLKTRVLTAFRKLHRTRASVFKGDTRALDAGREKINSEFKKHKDVTDSSKIVELLQIAEESEKILRTEVVQGRLVDENTYQVKISKDTALGDNTLFKHDVILPPPRRRKKSTEKDGSSS